MNSRLRYLYYKVRWMLKSKRAKEKAFQKWCPDVKTIQFKRHQPFEENRPE